jgi:hypothetical protein
MNKVSFDDFTKKLQEVTSDLIEDEKFDFYTELLETGSNQLGNGYEVIIFSIVNGLEYEIRKIEEINQEDLQEIENTIDEINDMDFTDDDDPIDFKQLELESDDLDDDVRELTNQELMEIGVIPSTQEKLTIDDLIEDIKLDIEYETHWMNENTDERKNEYYEKILTRDNFILTVLKFYKDKVKLQASDGESK